MHFPSTLGDLKKSGYASRSVKEELRANLIARIRAKQPLFEGIHGYEHTVVPALERAILAGHSINLLGLRGQAKTRMARSLVQLLDEWMPVIEGSEINDDPLAPISRFASPRMVPGAIRTCTHSACLPSGARVGSKAVGWPTTRIGSSGSSPASACW